MNTPAILVMMTLFGIEIGFARDVQILGEVRKEVVSLENGAGDVWDYSGSGGYVFRFSQDVLGDGAAESFVNVSVRPNIWHVFTGDDSKSYIGDVTIGGGGFQLRRDDVSATLIRAYEAGAFEKYILEQKITATGIQKCARKVGEGATEKEYQAVLNRITSNKTTWVAPRMEGILLYDLLNQSTPQWFEFNPDKAQVRNGYYRLLGDESRISELQNVFTPKIALKALNQDLGISQPIETQDPTPPSNRVQLTPVPATPTPALVQQPRPTASPTATGEGKSSLGFPIITGAILAAVIVGILVFFVRRKSS